MAKTIKISTNKKNKKIGQICPVCKHVKKLTIHHILPKFVFREIETGDKSYFLGGNSCWLCRKCHIKYEKHAEHLKNDILELFSFSKN